MLAKELGAQLTLIDERRARRYAIGEGLEIIGCIGIPEVLYRRSHLANLRDAYSRLLANEFRIDHAALQESLARLKLPPL